MTAAAMERNSMPAAASPAEFSVQPLECVKAFQFGAACQVGLDTSATASLILERTGTIKMASAELHIMAGWSPLALDGRHLAEALPDDAVASRRPLLELAFADRQSRRRVETHPLRSAELVCVGGRRPVHILVAEPPAGVADDYAVIHIIPREQDGSP